MIFSKQCLHQKLKYSVVELFSCSVVQSFSRSVVQSFSRSVVQSLSFIIRHKIYSLKQYFTFQTSKYTLDIKYYIVNWIESVKMNQVISKWKTKNHECLLKINIKAILFYYLEKMLVLYLSCLSHCKVIFYLKIILTYWHDRLSKFQWIKSFLPYWYLQIQFIF